MLNSRISLNYYTDPFSDWLYGEYCIDKEPVGLLENTNMEYWLCRLSPTALDAIRDNFTAERKESEQREANHQKALSQTSACL